MDFIKFDSNFGFVDSEDEMESFTEEQIKNETMFFNSTIEYAYDKGGPITKNFIELLPEEYKGGVFDSRVHMLMKGWYPCIPGWHHDDVPRTRRDGQPNYENPEYKSRHILALVNGDIAPTEFAIGTCYLPVIPIGEVIYKHWHTDIEMLINNGVLTKEKAPTNTLIEMNDETFHTGSAAVREGWRWFGRVSINTNRKPTNEIRRQVNVYMDNPNIGW